MSLMIESISACPCQSGEAFSDCCAPYISGEQLPKTASLLMRSRYTAYVLANINYLQETTLPSMRARYDFASLKQWAEDSEWLSLDVHSEDTEGDAARVCFTARYRQKGDIFNHSEDSQFIREQNRWFFSQGKDYTPPATKNLGRNDPCNCGSGKKFKKCCMNK